MPRQNPTSEPQSSNIDPRVSVVVPVFNEEGNLSALDEELSTVLREIPGGAELIYVDDHSTDSSRGILREIVRSRRCFVTRLIELRRNYGQTAALAAGFDHARGTVIVALDADLQNPPGEIPRLLRIIDEGFDVVSGWRRERRDAAFSRRLPSRAANWLVGVLTGLRLHDYGCTLKAYRSELLHEIRLYGENHRFIPVFLHGIGARITEVEVEHRPRFSGKSKYGLRRVLKVLLDLVLLRFLSVYAARPMHFFGQAALGFSFLCSGVGLLMLAFKYGWLDHFGIDYRASFVETPLPALGATFLLGAVVSLFFGVLAEILARVHYESGGAKSYRVRRVVASEQIPGP